VRLSGSLHDLLRRAGRHQAPAVLAGARPENRRHGRPPGSCRGRARRRSPCCRRAAARAGSDELCGCRGGAVRCSARRGCRGRDELRAIWVASRMRCASPPERLRVSGERQVAEPYVEEEAQSRAHLFRIRPPDDLLVAVPARDSRRTERPLDRQVADGADVEPPTRTARLSAAAAFPCSRAVLERHERLDSTGGRRRSSSRGSCARAGARAPRNGR